MGKSSANNILNVSAMKASQYRSNNNNNDNNRFKVIPAKLRVGKYNFVHSFRPVYYLSRIFGLMPFTMKLCDTNQRIQKAQVTVFDGVWFLISISLYISMAIIAWKTMDLPQKTIQSSYILILGDNLLLIVGLVYSALIIAFDMHNRSKLVEILNKFVTFDKEVIFVHFILILIFLKCFD